MTIACSVSVKRCSQGKAVYDSRGAQVNRFKNQFPDPVCRELSRTKGVYQEGYRLGNADGVTDLDLTPIRQSRRNHILRQVPGHIRTTSVDL